MSGYIYACLYVEGIWVYLNGMILLTEKWHLYNCVDDNSRYAINKDIEKIKERFRKDFVTLRFLTLVMKLKDQHMLPIQYIFFKFNKSLLIYQILFEPSQIFMNYPVNLSFIQLNKFWKT